MSAATGQGGRRDAHSHNWRVANRVRGRQALERRILRKAYVRCGEGPPEKGWSQHLAGGLLYARTTRAWFRYVLTVQARLGRLPRANFGSTSCELSTHFQAQNEPCQDSRLNRARPARMKPPCTCVGALAGAKDDGHAMARRIPLPIARHRDRRGTDARAQRETA